MKPREPRRNVVIQARMRSDGAWMDVCIRNISSRGFLLQAASPPPRGTYVEIFRGKHAVIGRVAWSKERRFGIHTQDRMNVDAIIDGSMAGSQQRAAGGERRSSARTPVPVAQQLERSRRISAAFEFGCIVACGAAAALITLNTVRETLSRPLQTIASHL